MNEARHEKRKAYVAAQTHYRAYFERYHPAPALGAKAPEAVTPEVLLELERLKAVTEAARIAWETPDPS